MNSCVFVGRLTKDPELTQGTNSEYANFSLAVNKAKDQVDYFDFVVFGKSAQFLVDYFKKGEPVSVLAEAKQDRWDDSEGKKRTKVSFVVRNLSFVPSSGTRKDNATPASTAPTAEAAANNDAEIPF